MIRKYMDVLDGIQIEYNKNKESLDVGSKDFYYTIRDTMIAPLLLEAAAEVVSQVFKVSGPEYWFNIRVEKFGKVNEKLRDGIHIHARPKDWR